MAESFAFATTTAPTQDPDAASVQWPSQDDATLLATAQTHWTQAEQAESAWRTKARKDQQFEAGEQWPPGIVEQRDRDRRPCLTIDRMGTHLRQVENEGRQSHQGMVVSAVDDQADPETAKIMRGQIRDIEQQSGADMAYTFARKNAIGPGRGFVRVLPEYIDPFSFKQELRIKPIRNLFSVYLDPAHIMPDGSDTNWAFIVSRMAKDDYERTYRRLPVEATHWAAEGDTWFNGSEVQVAEYYWREQHPLDIALLEGGQVFPVDRVPDDQRGLIVKTRTTRVPYVWWAKINGHEVLEKTRWLGQYIPIAQYVGEIMDQEGEVDYRGMTRRLKDPQQMANYWFTAFTEGVALAPKNAFVGAYEQFQGFEEYWNAANTSNYSYLPYNPAQVAGTVLPPPQRSAVEPAVQAMMQGVAMAADHINAISGYHDQVQDQDPAISGEAIKRRQQGTNNATYHFQDHERWMLRHLGRIIVDAIPHYYDEAQTIRIVGDDEQVRQVLINQHHVDEDGKAQLYDVTVGRYDVRVDGGPSFATKRQDAVDKLSPIMGSSEWLQHTIGDIYFRSLDVDFAEQAANRLKKAMPPELLADEPGAEKFAKAQEQMQLAQKAPLLEEELKKVQGQMMQMQQSMQSLTMDNQQLRLAVQNKERELALKQQLEEHKLALQAQEQAHEARMAELELQVAEFEARTDRMQALQPRATNGAREG